jgi:phosphohistidine phosphatase
MMELYLLRHGIATERGKESRGGDAQRPLISEGRGKMRRIAKAMRALELSFDLILSSPLLRARQTADIVAEEFKLAEQLKLSSHLAPEGDPRDLVRDLKRLHRGSRKVLLVGHEPYLSNLMATLLAGHPVIDINLRKGGFCLLSIDSLQNGRCATLEWLLTPRQMTKIR